MKCVWGDVSYRGEKVVSILNNSGMTLVYICVAFYVFLLINIVITNSSWGKFRCLKITENFKLINKEINSNLANIVVCAICFGFVLISITNYSALSIDNVEGDRAWQYAINGSFFERCLISFVNVGFPVFFLLTIRCFFEQNAKKNKLKIVALILGILCLLLGSRTVMLQTAVIVCVYIYACYREKITKKMFWGTFGIMIAIPILIFPISQQFRIVKVITVEKGEGHDFSDVVHNFMTLSTDTKAEVFERSMRETDGRSMNVFIAFNESVNNSYESTGGDQLFDNLLCINPLHKPSPVLNNINADKLEGGGDIAESFFTVMNIDLGLAGIFFVTPLFLLLVSFLITLLCTKAAFYFKVKELLFLPIVFILIQCITIERVPSIRVIYNPTIITIFMFGIVFRLCNKF